jgi:tricarballylate dehydrogenase
MIQTWDVAVVGTGVAGLSAALSAAQSGAAVRVIERAPESRHGGNTRYTEAFLRMQSIDKVSEDFEDRFAEMSGYHTDPTFMTESALDPARRSQLTRAAGFLDPDIIATFAEHAGPTLRWMETCGVKFDDADTPFITASTTRLAPVGGGLAIVEALTAQCRSAGVTFTFETSAVDLLTSADRQVTGLKVRSNVGQEDVQASTVILACGGFQGNPEMLARYMPRARFTRPVALGGYYNRGEGIEMAIRAGAATCGDFNLFHAEPIDPRSGAPEAAVFAFGYGVLVNRHARRFVDEASGTSDATYEAVTRVILEQPDGIAYVIFDRSLDDVPNYRRAIRTDQAPVQADSIAELARQLAINPATLTATIDSYNAACTGGPFSPLNLDGLSTQGLTPPKSNWARPIATPPFAAYPIMSANVFTFGGLKTDVDARVLDSDGRPIVGLYAAGETMGVYYGTYTGSTSVLRGAVFGRLAGLHASRSFTSPKEVTTA